jgi:hypothetical protein
MNKRKFNEEELKILEEFANERGWSFEKGFKTEKEKKEMMEIVWDGEIKPRLKREREKQEEIKDIKTFTNNHNKRILKERKKDNLPPPISILEKSEEETRSEEEKNKELLEQDQYSSIEKNVKINLGKILNSKKPINIILTATSLGKSLGFAIWVCRQILADENKIFIWVRRYEKEIQNTVAGMFRELLGKSARITISGIFIDGRKVVYFIPLSLYYNYKSLTGITDKLQAVIFDEAIPVNKKWLDDNYSTEEEKFGKLMNIVARDDKKLPLYFLCNPNAKGAWIIQKWAPFYKPSEEKEKIESKGDVFIYSMPWPENKKRGVIDLLESIETQKTTKQGLYPENEDLFITDEKPSHYVYSFVIAGREMEFGKRYDDFIISEAEKERKNKKIIVFKRGDTIIHENAVLGDKKWYADWWYNLLSSKRLKFNSHSVRDHFIYKTSQDFRW